MAAFTQGVSTNYKIEASMTGEKTSRAIEYDCEGDIKWIPRSVHFLHGNGIIEIPEWYYDKYFKN